MKKIKKNKKVWSSSEQRKLNNDRRKKDPSCKYILESKIQYMLTEDESKDLYRKTIRKNLTREDYIEMYINRKLNKWKKNHPEPQTTDLFYKEEHPKWTAEYESIHDKIVAIVNKTYVTKYTKRTINFILDSRNKYSSLETAA